MDGRDCVDCLDFHNYKRFHENVQAESEIKPNTVVDHRQGKLHGGAKSSLVQFMDQTSQIHAFVPVGG
jgi:hypothetical protein